MSWKSIAERLQDGLVLPTVLAGPILRRVEPGSVSVWIALKDSARVSLQILRNTGVEPDTWAPHGASNEAETIAIGKNLHMLVLTWSPGANEQSLQPNVTYGYDVSFHRVGNNNHAPAKTLRSGGIMVPGNADLPERAAANEPGDDPYRYPGLSYPTFSLPPTDINDTRIIHASCRKPHGENLDAFTALEQMLMRTALKADERPHQLFLTGDQIYADDVADHFLEEIMHTGDWIFDLGIGPGQKAPEPLPYNDNEGQLQTTTAGAHGPAQRTYLLEESAKLTAGKKVLKSHLMSFSEFCTMYLYAWSPVLWPTDMPDILTLYPPEALYMELGEDAFESPKKLSMSSIAANHERKGIRLRLKRAKALAWQNRYYWKTRGDHQKDLKAFLVRDQLRRIRRSLANIPTYMVFDDHEVTDDWYLNAEWCKKVLGNPLGKRILQNGLTAYGIFQHWGNRPDAFTGGTPGQSLLQNVGALHDAGAAQTQAREACRIAVGIPPDVQGNNLFDNKGQLVIAGAQPSDSLSWHFKIDFPNYEVIVLNTRTERSFETTNPIAFPRLLSKSAMNRQIGTTFNPSHKFSLVVAPAPVFGWPFIEEVQYGNEDQDGREDKDTEAWSLQPLQLEMFLARFATRTPTGANPNATAPPVLFLSGDVHYGFAQKVNYHSEKPYQVFVAQGADPAPGRDMVFVQLTASSLKNETSIRSGLMGTYRSHKMGYKINGDKLPRNDVYGWNRTLLPNDYRGERDRSCDCIRSCLGFKSPYEDLKPEGTQGDGRLTPITVFNRGIYPNFGVRPPLGDSDDIKPHWWYDVEYILAENENMTRMEVQGHRDIDHPLYPHPAPANREYAIYHYLATDDNREEYRKKWYHGKELVGLNNLGELQFQFSEDGQTAKVLQFLWWRWEDLDTAHRETFPLSLFEASLKIAEGREIKRRQIYIPDQP
jgi:hypothetical protein